VLKKDERCILVQCKQWKAWKVGVPVVREVFGVMTAEKAHRAIIVTSGTFTQDAHTFANGKPIDLVEGPQLADLIRAVQATPASASPSTQCRAPATPPPSPNPPTHSTTASESARPLVPPKPGPTKTCPKCGAAMVLRTAKQGPSVGQQFWGCANFPRCRATAPAVSE
jgi:restriction system protein